MLSNNQQAFLALVRAGLWEKEVRLSVYSPIDFNVVYQLAQEQTVIGIVAAGIEHVVDVKVPKEDVLAIAGETIQIEQRNNAMNDFVGELIGKMRNAGIYAILVKGQGIAQCYERPSWRSCGDVDLLLSSENYDKAVTYLRTAATSVGENKPRIKHMALTIDAWEVELHGTLHSQLWRRLDKAVDASQNAVFFDGKVRSWMNGGTQIFLPKADEDIIFIFSHILQHFFSEGIGLRQVCDWCRLLWTYKDSLDKDLLYYRIKKAGAVSEWKAFASFAVKYLGMPPEAIPFYTNHKKWERKSVQILYFILETGNFGHNRDYSYYRQYPFLVYKAISFLRHTGDSIRYFAIFPWDSVKVWCRMIQCGFRKICCA